jgi:hypothetical protein
LVTAYIWAARQSEPGCYRSIYRLTATDAAPDPVAPGHLDGRAPGRAANQFHEDDRFGPWELLGEVYGDACRTATNGMFVRRPDGTMWKAEEIVDGRYYRQPDVA